ncbi:MAG: TAXI family TRAP transporter solute-binding subunit, partial [Pseudomonadota bacterium]
MARPALQALLTLGFTLLAGTFLLSGCERSVPPLTLARPSSPIEERVAESIVATLEEESTFAFALTDTTLSEEAALDALANGTLDLALISNSMPYRNSVSSILPVYSTALHIGSSRTEEVADLRELLEGANVFSGEAGSASRVLFDRIVRLPEFRDLSFSFANPESGGPVPDVFMLFAPVAAPFVSEQMRSAPEFQLLSMGDPESIGRGSVVDAATLSNPFFRPFIIPIGVYAGLPEEPVLTVAVDKMLVARPDLEASTVYDLIGELLRLRPALAARNPGLFRE